MDFESVWPAYEEQMDELSRPLIEKQNLMPKIKAQMAEAWEEIKRTQPVAVTKPLRLGVTRRVEFYDGKRTYCYDVQAWSAAEECTYSFYAANWGEICSYQIMMSCIDRYSDKVVAAAFLQELTAKGLTAAEVDEEHERFIQSLKKSEEDIKAGRVHSVEEVFQGLDKKYGLPPTPEQTAEEKAADKVEIAAALTETEKEWRLLCELDSLAAADI